MGVSIMDKLSLDSDGYAIPFNEVIRLIEFFPLANKYRVAFTMIALTGCRIAELNNMGVDSILGEYIIWKTGKNQTGYRKEKLPIWFIEEIKEYLSKCPHCNKKLFPYNTEWLRDILNKQIRPTLGGDWIKKKPQPTKKGAVKFNYIYQLKGLRHNFATLDFYNQFSRWGGTVAVEFTAKRMKHSSYKMTASHYIGNFERLKIEQYKGLEMSTILKTEKQNRLTEYF